MGMRASLDRRGQTFWLIVGSVLVVVIGTADVLTGPELSLSFFYLVPIVLVVWFVGSRAGLVMALCCGMAWFVADALSGQSYSSEWIRYWNALVRLGFFFVVALLLPALKALERESWPVSTT